MAAVIANLDMEKIQEMSVQADATFAQVFNGIIENPLMDVVYDAGSFSTLKYQPRYELPLPAGRAFDEVAGRINHILHSHAKDFAATCYENSIFMKEKMLRTAVDPLTDANTAGRKLGEDAQKRKIQIISDALFTGAAGTAYTDVVFSHEHKWTSIGTYVFDNIVGDVGTFTGKASYVLAENAIVYANDSVNAPRFTMDSTDSTIHNHQAIGMGYFLESLAFVNTPMHAIKIAATLDEENLLEAYNRMVLAKNQEGEVMDIKPMLLLVHQTNLVAAKKLVEATINASGASNVLYGLIKVAAYKN